MKVSEADSLTHERTLPRRRRCGRESSADVAQHPAQEDRCDAGLDQVLFEVGRYPDSALARTFQAPQPHHPIPSKRVQIEHPSTIANMEAKVALLLL